MERFRKRAGWISVTAAPIRGWFGFVQNVVVSAVAAISLLCGGCGDDNPTSPGGGSGACDIDPQDYNWVIEVYDPYAQDIRPLQVVYNGSINVLDPPEISLRIEGAPIPLTFSGYGNWWIGEASLSAGSSYTFEFTAEGQKTSGDLTIAFTPSASFPDAIVAGQPATVTWTLDGAAGCQAAAAGSGDMQDDEEYYVKLLSKTARSYTFPAGCVPGWGDGETYLSLAIFNRNATTVGTTLILISNGLATREYQD